MRAEWTGPGASLAPQGVSPTHWLPRLPVPVGWAYMTPGVANVAGWLLTLNHPTGAGCAFVVASTSGSAYCLRSVFARGMRGEEGGLEPATHAGPVGVVGIAEGTVQIALFRHDHTDLRVHHQREQQRQGPHDSERTGQAAVKQD
jgi:hypothetical protein